LPHTFPKEVLNKTDIAWGHFAGVHVKGEADEESEF